MTVRMLDLIRNSEVPSTLMQSAARGALAVSPAETIEILVYLALHHKLFGEQARLTLAGWDEKASLEAAADPHTSPEVLGYLVSPDNLRPCLLLALTENPAVAEEALDRLAVSGSRAVIETFFMSSRVMRSARLLEALQTNPSLRPSELAEIGARLARLEGNAVVEPSEAEAPDEVVEATMANYLAENAAELAAEKDKPFQPIGLALEDSGAEAEVNVAEGVEELQVEEQRGEDGADPLEGNGQTTPGEVAKIAGAAPARAAGKPRKHAVIVPVERRDSPLQRISKLDIRGRISLAMRGSKEDRTILIRDSTKLVAVAVLESPKVSDGEVESFAQQKNVLESVLRAIPLKRRFAKNYKIVRNLVYNPRTPLDLSLGLMKNLLVRDLKNLADNKEVADTIRKVAMRMYRQKMEKKG